MPLADRQLAAFPVAGDGPLVAARATVRQGRLACPQIIDELCMTAGWCEPPR